MMIFGLVVELGTHGILRNFLLGHLLDLQQAPQQVLFRGYLPLMPALIFVFLCFIFIFIGPFHFMVYLYQLLHTKKKNKNVLKILVSCLSDFIYCITGMVPFAFGTETAGSITFPATRCGVTALHPNFGTIGRSGVMSRKLGKTQIIPCYL